MRSRVIDDADMEGVNVTADERCRLSAGAELPVVCDVRWPVSVVPGSVARGGGAIRCVLRSAGNGCGRIEVWREYPDGGEAMMLFSEPVDMSTSSGDGWTHLAAFGHGERMSMVVSVDTDGRIRYIAAPVLHEAGVAAGSCDAPLIRDAVAEFPPPANG